MLCILLESFLYLLPFMNEHSCISPRKTPKPHVNTRRCIYSFITLLSAATLLEVVKSKLQKKVTPDLE